MAAEKLRQLSAERQDGAQRHHISCTPVAPFDLCRLHQQLGGAAIMARYTFLASAKPHMALM